MTPLFQALDSEKKASVQIRHPEKDTPIRKYSRNQKTGDKNIRFCPTWPTTAQLEQANAFVVLKWAWFNG